jgi:hypothetical protein
MKFLFSTRLPNCLLCSRATRMGAWNPFVCREPDKWRYYPGDWKRKIGIYVIVLVLMFPSVPEITLKCAAVDETQPAKKDAYLRSFRFSSFRYSGVPFGVFYSALLSLSIPCLSRISDLRYHSHVDGGIQGCVCHDTLPHRQPSRSHVGLTRTVPVTVSHWYLQKSRPREIDRM